MEQKTNCFDFAKNAELKKTGFIIYDKSSASLAQSLKKTYSLQIDMQVDENMCATSAFGAQAICNKINYYCLGSGIILAENSFYHSLQLLLTRNKSDVELFWMRPSRLKFNPLEQIWNLNPDFTSKDLKRLQKDGFDLQVFQKFDAIIVDKSDSTSIIAGIYAYYEYNRTHGTKPLLCVFDNNLDGTLGFYEDLFSVKFSKLPKDGNVLLVSRQSYLKTQRGHLQYLLQSYNECYFVLDEKMRFESIMSQKVKIERYFDI